jgi:hypothetical protein
MAYVLPDPEPDAEPAEPAPAVVAEDPLLEELLHAVATNIRTTATVATRFTNRIPTPLVACHSYYMGAAGLMK